MIKIHVAMVIFFAWWGIGFCTLVALMALAPALHRYRRRGAHRTMSDARSLFAFAIVGLLGPLLPLGLALFILLSGRRRIERFPRLPSRDIVLMAFPRDGDPYTDCFYPALEKCSVKVIRGDFSGRWLIRNLRGVDYVHFNWPSFFYNRDEPVPAIRGFGLFLFLIGLAKSRGAGIIWTAHNLFPHDRSVIPQLDDLCRWAVVRSSDRIFILGKSAKKELETIP